MSTMGLLMSMPIALPVNIGPVGAAAAVLAAGAADLPGAAEPAGVASDELEPQAAAKRAMVAMLATRTMRMSAPGRTVGPRTHVRIIPSLATSSPSVSHRNGRSDGPGDDAEPFHQRDPQQRDGRS